MNSAEVIASLRTAIPPVMCKPACTDCCGAVPWSHLEWEQLPAVFKKKVVANEVCIRSPLSKLDRKVILPLRYQLKGDSTIILWHKKYWMQLYSIRPLKANRCVFLTPDERGCTVYQYRPIVCRLFGTILDDRAACRHGCHSIPQLHWELGKTMTQAWWECMEPE